MAPTDAPVVRLRRAPLLALLLQRGGELSCLVKRITGQHTFQPMGGKLQLMRIRAV